MALSSTPQAWTLEMPVGSLAEYLFTFTYPSTGALYPITGATWQYVAQSAAGSQVISVTPSANSQGILTVGTAASTVQLNLYPPATQSLAAGNYTHALWMNPDSSTGAFCWFDGALILGSTPQP